MLHVNVTWPWAAHQHNNITYNTVNIKAVTMWGTCMLQCVKWANKRLQDTGKKAQNTALFHQGPAPHLNLSEQFQTDKHYSVNWGFHIIQKNAWGEGEGICKKAKDEPVDP